MRMHAFRLPPGTDLKAELQRLTAQQELRAACHLHVSLARRDGACIGGHLVEGCIVRTTAELVIGELPEVEFRRPLDTVTGYNELSIGPRGSDDDGSV